MWWELNQSDCLYEGQKGTEGAEGTEDMEGTEGMVGAENINKLWNKMEDTHCSGAWLLFCLLRIYCWMFCCSV